MSNLQVFVIALISLVLTGLFSGAETGLMTVSRVRLQRGGGQATGRVRRLLARLRHLEDPILTCLIGTNLFNVTFTALVTAALAADFPGHGEWLSVVICSVIIILLGEIIPKVMFREFPERLTLWAEPAVTFFATILGPARWLLLGYTRLWRRLLPATDDSGQRLDRSGVAALLLASAPPSADDQRFAVTLDRFLQLAGHPLREIMRPLEAVVRVGPEATVGECLAIAADSGFSRLPVSREGGRQLRAYLVVRDLIFLPREDHDQPVPKRLWHPFLLVDERMSPYELFEEMRSQQGQLAVVVDPGGNPLGLLTLEDLIETVVGAVRDEFDKVPAQGRTGEAK